MHLKIQYQHACYFFHIIINQHKMQHGHPLSFNIYRWNILQLISMRVLMLVPLQTIQYTQSNGPYLEIIA